MTRSQMETLNFSLESSPWGPQDMASSMLTLWVPSPGCGLVSGELIIQSLRSIVR